MNLFNKTLVLPGSGRAVGTGWIPARPDLRDFTADTSEIRKLASKMDIKEQKLPSLVDLRQWFPPADDQSTLGSCTAHAGTAIVDYFQNRSFGKCLKGSRLFLYKTTRNLMQETGDTGAFIRTTMAALVMCGIPPEKYYPYITDDFDKEPGSFIYSIADNFETVKYFSHDPAGKPGDTTSVLRSVKEHLASGIPSMFGFWGFDSFSDTDEKGGIPYPSSGEQAQWGHAVAATGYDDSKKITNRKNRKSTTGALLIRNSWGTSWGDNGYGWLPYDYVLSSLAMDFWSLLSQEWVDTGEFGV